MSRVLSGIQPSHGGMPHLGNYLGALRAFSGLQTDHEALFCVADLHATTTDYDPKALPHAVLTTAASLLACGIDPARSVVFQQSHVAAHARLFVLLCHTAHLGPLERMTQFKEKGREAEGDQRDAIGFGLLSYPVLMAADILAYQTHLVPVGHDQRQHLQLAQELAQRFSHRFGTTNGVPVFVAPQALLQPNAARVMGLRDPTRKMSKSMPEGCIFLSDPIDVVAKKIRRAVSETQALPSEVSGLADRPAAKSLLDMLSGLSDTPIPALCARFGNGGFAPLKAALIEAYEAKLGSVRTELATRMTPEGLLHVRAVLDAGSVRAAALAEDTVLRAEGAMGLRGLGRPMAQMGNSKH